MVKNKNDISYNNTWQLNKFQSWSLSEVVNAMNTLYGFMSNNEYNGAKSTLEFTNPQFGAQYYGAVIYNHEIKHHPTFNSSFNTWKLFSAGGNYQAQKDEVYSDVMTFINTQLSPTQAYYAKSETSQVSDNTYLPMQMFVWYPSFDSEVVVDISKPQVLSESKWTVKPFAESTVLSIGNAITTFMNVMSTNQSLCSSPAVDAFFNENNGNYQPFGAILSPLGIETLPDRSTIGYNWHSHIETGSLQDICQTMSSFVNNLTDAQACYGKMDITSGTDSNSTLVFWYPDSLV